LVGRSAETSVDGRRHPRREGIVEEEALQKGMEAKALEFKKAAAEIYKKA
jgi:phosphomethylpyrimidine synthase